MIDVEACISPRSGTVKTTRMRCFLGTWVGYGGCVSDQTSKRLTPVRLERAIRDAYDAELRLADEFTAAAERHAVDADVFRPCMTFGEQAREHALRLRAFAERCEPASDKRVGERDSELQLLSDLRRVYLTTQECWVHLTLVRQAALARGDEELLYRIEPCLGGTLSQLRWVKTQIKTSAARVLTAE